MIEKIFAALAAFVIGVIQSLGYGGVVLLMAIESACIPLPSEVIMPFSGYLVSRGVMDLWLVSLAGAIGCVLGSVVAYYAGAGGGRPLIERYGKYVLISSHDLDLADRVFERWGQIAVLVGRLLPVVRTFIAFPAGVAKMPQLRFHIYTFIGSWPWCYALAYAGMRLGQAWETDPRFHEWFHRFHLVVELGLLAAIVWFLWTHVSRIRQANQA